VTTTNPDIVLASGSPRRKELLSTLGLPFRAEVSDADEHIAEQIPPSAFVETLARRKASAIAAKYQATQRDTVIIGADTIVVLDGQILGKPTSEAHAEDMLTMLQGRTHEVYTGLCVWRIPDGRTLVSHSRTEVTMRPLTREEITRYVKSGEPMDKAGAYAIQGLGSTLVTGIHGDYFTVVGLPLYLLADFFRQLGWSIF
jgi:septum formation protein